MAAVCSVEDCEKPTLARGWCGMHWARWRRNGDPLITQTPNRVTGDLATRFWAKVDKTADCWLWTDVPVGGYAKMFVKDGPKMAHHVSYELNIGPIPERSWVQHACENNLCVRPDHLRLIPRQEHAEYVAPTLEERFWGRVNKTDGCWEWFGGKGSHGYGSISVDGERTLVHRHSYRIHHGPIPPGLYVDHMCHNRLCVHPDHLRLATHKQNLENRAGAARNSKSGVRGVSWEPSRRQWHAQIGHNGRTRHVGWFTDIGEATAAVEAKRNELFTHNIEGCVA